MDNEFFEDFETYAKGDVFTDVSCFTQVQSEGGSTMKPFEVSEKYARSSSTDTVYAYSGDKYARAAYSSYSWVFRPVKLRAGVKYEISGYFRQDGTNNTTTSVSLGFATLPNVSSVTKTVEKVFVVDEWQRIQGYFEAPSDGVYYAGWNIDQNGSPWFNAMDALRVREVVSIPPSSSLVTNISPTSATINWTSNDTEWEVKVTTGDAGGDAVSGIVFHDTVQVKYQAVDDLTPNTKYYYYIRTIRNGIASDWTSASFRTSCTAYTLPYGEDFEDATETDLMCWTAIDSDEGAEHTRSTTYAYQGDASYKVSKASVYTPEFNVVSLADYMVTGWVRSTADSVRFAIGLNTSPADLSDYEEIGTVLVPKSGVWQEFTAYFNILNEPDYADYDPKYVAIVALGDATFYFDDILVDEIPSCPKPTEAEIKAVSDTSVTLSWKANAGESSWVVGVERSGVALFDTVVTTNPCTIIGLTPAMSYSLNISAVCAVGDTSYTVPFGDIVTECAAMRVPYSMILDDVAASGLPACWEHGEGTTVATSSYGWGKITTGGVNSLQYNDYGSSTHYWQELVTPIFVLGENEATELVFESEIGALAGDMILRLSTDGGVTYNDTLGIIAKGGGRLSHRYDLSQYAGNRVRFILEAHGGTSSSYTTKLYSFDLGTIGGCQRPQSINLVDATENTIVVTVGDTASAHTAWEVVCGPIGFDPNTATPVAMSADGQWTITGLSGSTAYEVCARTICSETEKVHGERQDSGRHVRLCRYLITRDLKTIRPLMI